MKVNLQDCTEITISQYCDLEEPEFMGQTPINSLGFYWMVWKQDDILYKTKNSMNY